MKYQKGFTAFEIILALFTLFGIGGWVANIIKLTGMSFDPLTGMVVARVIGIFFAPLGAILGYL